MTEKPATAGGYRGEHLALVRGTCLYLATKLGDLMDDLVVVGGLVPSLLVDQGRSEAGFERHAGTMDLDLGLKAALLNRGRYREISDRLRRCGFAPDENAAGNPTRQRWKIEKREKVTIDFLMPPTSPEERGGSLRDLEPDFAAVVAPGLDLAFRDRVRIMLSGQTIAGEDATREIWVCGAGAFVVLKALAFDLRGENKDAYDLFYVLRNYGASPEGVVEHLRPLLDDENTTRAIEILRRDFLSENGVGPRRVAEFRTGGSDDSTQADVVGFVGDLLRRLGVSK
ncbi:MAG: hypothetical protein ABI689_04945 [Thermoanaerobaculia bacterium]